MTAPPSEEGAGSPTDPLPVPAPRRLSRGAASWWRTVVLGSLEALGRPELWPGALLGFLGRGGLVLFLLPIVALPTPVGVASFVGLGAVSIAGDPSQRLIVALGVGAFVFAAWLMLAGLLASATDVALVWAVLESPAGLDRLETRGARSVPGGGLLARLLAIRLVSLLPLALALGWWATRILQVAYQELTAPLDLATPIVVRALVDAADADVVVLCAWLVGEAYGALATRRFLFGARSAAAALVAGLLDMVRHPATTAATLLLGVLGSLVLVGPPLVGAGIGWSRLAVAARDWAGGWAEVLGSSLLLVLLLVAWLGGLALAGAASAWRSALWTLQAARSAGLLATLDGPMPGRDEPQDGAIRTARGRREGA